ncbi:glycosyltransferase [Bacillaceae bacterium IKA-2]|nr:glycosyltransferase [Bacillaceae bacterium IKA-2]
MTKLSIIVPVYNTEEYLSDCIESILLQSFMDYEIILINDGSSDKSGEICKQYAKKDSRIKVFHKSNEGPSAARNLGIKLASGEFLGFVDSDDTINVQMYEKLYNLAKEKNAEISICGYSEIYFPSGKIDNFTTPLNNIVYLKGKEIREEFEHSLSANTYLGYNSLCNKIYNRKYLLRNSLIINENIKIAEDQCFNISAILKAKIICAINEPLYNYRRINSKSIMNKKEGAFYQLITARKEILRTLSINKVNQGLIDKIEKIENCKTVANYLEEIINTYKSKQSMQQKVKWVKKLIYEKYFIEAIKNYDKNDLLLKANVVVTFIKCYLAFKGDLLFKER